MSNDDVKVRIAQQLEELETEYETKRTAYRQMGDDVGWRSARAWLDYLEDCIRRKCDDLENLGVTPKRRVVVAHN